MEVGYNKPGRELLYFLKAVLGTNGFAGFILQKDEPLGPLFCLLLENSLLNVRERNGEAEIDKT